MQMHSRLTKRRGPARKHQCVDCGGQALDWSYNGKDPDEVTSISRYGKVVTHSYHDEYYEPRCRPCHNDLDREVSHEKGPLSAAP
jgi:hypothetical protein